MSSVPLPSSQLAESYEQYRRSRGERMLAGTQVRLTPDERTIVSRHVWRGSPQGKVSDGREPTLTELELNGIRIECVSTEPRNTLADRMETSRNRQAEDDRQLASTFCHDGSMFLVFKKRET